MTNEPAIPPRKKLPLAAIVGIVGLLIAVVYPFVPDLNQNIFRSIGTDIGNEMPTLFIYCIVALGLHVVVGNAGILHLGIGAFFAVGAFTTGILAVANYPFQFDLIPCMICSMLVAATLAVVVSAPMLRLRGDYLALVTLGFGEVTRYVLRNFEEITNGTKTLGPLSSPKFLDWPAKQLGLTLNWQSYECWYFVTLVLLVAVFLFLRNLERSRIGRAWVAVREDELAATCMGIRSSTLKLLAFAIAGGLAGMAGSLYTFKLSNTSFPDQYGFNTSVLILVCLILGGLGNRWGVVLGVLLVVGFENIVAPTVDQHLKQQLGQNDHFYMLPGFWKMFIFGLVLVVVMRFRPEGLVPERRDR
ncbi:MAG: branched-chain amino acid ABC transporter permease [Zavarzinella sp.]